MSVLSRLCRRVVEATAANGGIPPESVEVEERDRDLLVTALNDYARLFSRDPLRIAKLDGSTLLVLDVPVVARRAA